MGGQAVPQRGIRPYRYRRAYPAARSAATRLALLAVRKEDVDADDGGTVEGVHQPVSSGREPLTLATGLGADPEAAVDVHQRPPSVPLSLK